MSKFKHMSDEELDKLFRDASKQFQPPAAPPGAWDHFYSTKLIEGLINDPGITAPNQRSGKKLLAFLKPAATWQFAATVLLAVLIAAILLISKEKTSKDVVIKRPTEINNPPITAPQQPDAGTNKTFSNKDSSNKITNSEPWKNIITETKPEQLISSSNTDFPAQPGFIPHVNLFPKKDSLVTKKQRGETITLNPKPADHKPTDKHFNLNPQWPFKNETAGNNNRSGSKWQVGLQGGSNLGMVKGDVSGKPGLNAGLLIQRSLGQSRFSLESGVIYESMTYDVANADFRPNGKPAPAAVSNIEGTCSMIDVPVNVRYDVVKSKKNKAFISTGVSPTVILKQSYIYDLDKGNGPVKINKDVSGQGKSVYAVANLSVGFEQKWNHVSVQIAPYVKIPMGDIGYGNLSLGGIGTQISIKKDL